MRSVAAGGDRPNGQRGLPGRSPSRRRRRHRGEQRAARPGGQKDPATPAPRARTAAPLPRVEQRIARLVDQVLALSPDRVLLTGDLTALGDATELEHARALLQPFIALGLLVVVPGNHDRYTDSRSRAFELVFADLLTSDLPDLADEGGYPFVKLLGEQHALVGLDSTRVQGWSHDVVGRRRGPARRRRASSGASRARAAHAPPARTPRPRGTVGPVRLERVRPPGRRGAAPHPPAPAGGAPPRSLPSPLLASRQARSSASHRRRQLHRTARFLGGPGGRPPRAGGGGPPPPLTPHSSRQRASTQVTLSLPPAAFARSMSCEARLLQLRGAREHLLDLRVRHHAGQAVRAQQEDVALLRLDPRPRPPAPCSFMPSARTMTFLCGKSSISSGVSFLALR